MADSAAGSPSASEEEDLHSDPQSDHGKPADSDDDVVSNVRRTVEADDDDDDDLDDDLFGDGDGGFDEEPSKHRGLDDEGLDSGDDEGRNDRALQDQEPQEERVLNFMDAEFARHAVPEPSDNELYLLKMPQFLSIEPTSFHHQTFQPPSTDHHSKGPPSSTFSAYNTALTMLRWRRSPPNPHELQSNARILRWSDGSLTLQFASDPTTQYEIDGKPLAPPQRNPPKPTPTSVKDLRTRHAGHVPYDANHDSFTYLVSPHESAGLFRVTNKMTTGLSINPTAVGADNALEQLQNALATAAARGRDPNTDGKIQVIEVREDPEEARRKAEAAEKQKLKQLRAREKHDVRERDRATRTYGRSSMRAAPGLSIGHLEEEGGTGRNRGARAKPRQRRGEIYSDEEEEYGRRYNKEDEYDEEDDFIAGSDEEEIAEEDDDDDIDEGIENLSRKKGRKESPKRAHGSDAGGDEDEDEVVANVGRAKRRRVVDDDDDDE